MRITLIAGFIVLSAASVARAADCTRDTECDGELACIDGHCMMPMTERPPPIPVNEAPAAPAEPPPELTPEEDEAPLTPTPAPRPHGP